MLGGRGPIALAGRADGDLQEPIAERLAVRIAFAAGSEDGGDAVLAALALRVGEALQGLVDDGVEALLEATEGLLHRLLHGGRDQVVVDGGGQLLGDEGIGVGVVDVDAFARLAAHEFSEELHEHGETSVTMSDGSPSPGVGP